MEWINEAIRRGLERGLDRGFEGGPGREVLRVVKAEPGLSASVYAEKVHSPLDEVLITLRHLEVDGLVRRTSVGWREGWRTAWWPSHARERSSTP